MIGTTLAHYRIVRQLGAGGMGEVFLAEDQRLQRQVALKLLPPEAGASESIERFRREARAIAALNHPNIVTIYSVEEEAGVHFLTMEHVDGETLCDVIPPHGLPVDRILELAAPLADALAAAHERGIVHRDLKPSNVMLTADGKPKILDFGLAKRETQDNDDADPTAETELRTQAGIVLGTAPYMSPEQLQGLPLDARTDIFSLGVLLFEMATGRRPFQGHSSAELVSSILRDVPPELDQHRRGLPPELGQIVGRCLEKDRELRYASARGLARDLEGLRTGALSAMTPARATVSTGGFRWRTMGAALAALLLLLTLGAAWRLLRPPRAADRLALAVLPFDNLTGDPDLDYLGQGLSAGLLSQLSEASGVRVMGRAATWSGRGSPARAARELGAGSLLEGELQGDAGHLLVDVRLTDTQTSLVLWTERFSGERDQLIGLQREIGERLVGVLSIPLSRRELDRMARDPTGSFEAYEYFMRGFRELELATGEQDPAAAATLFRQALRLDPEFALAHTGLSEALWRRSRVDRSAEHLVEAETAARRALEIDPELPAAQVALARVHRSRGRSNASIVELREALAGHPKPDEALLELAASYTQTGDLESAEESLREAIALRDDWFTRNLLGMFLARNGRYAEARAEFELAARTAGEASTQPRENLATLDLTQGRYDEAIAAFELLPRPILRARLASNIGTAYYYSAHPQRAERVEEFYKLAIELSPRRDIYRANLADLYLEQGREAEARKSYRMAWALVEEQLEANPEHAGLLLRRAMYEAKGGECDLAVPHAAALVLTPPQTGPKAYQLAKVFALCEERPAALDALRLARRLGESGEHMRRDAEFGSLADDPDFQEIVEAP